MPVDRTTYNTLVNDSGSNLDGTPITKAVIGGLLDDIDKGLKKYVASVYNSAAQVVSNNTETVITFNTEDFDAQGLHSTSVNTGRLTIPAGAVTQAYRIRAQVFFLTSAAGTIGYLSIRKNGSRVVSTYENLWGSMTLTMQVEALVSLAVGDFIDIVFLQNTGSGINVGSTNPEYANRLELSSEGQE